MKRIVQVSILLTGFIILLVLGGCSLESQAIKTTIGGSYASMFKWNDTIFYESVSEVQQENVGDLLGQITGQVQPPQHNGESNNLSLGIKVFSIKGKNPYEYVTFENNGKYFEALSNIGVNKK